MEDLIVESEEIDDSFPSIQHVLDSFEKTKVILMLDIGTTVFGKIRGTIDKSSSKQNTFREYYFFPYYNEFPIRLCHWSKLAKLLLSKRQDLIGGEKFKYAFCTSIFSPHPRQHNTWLNPYPLD